MVYAVSLNLNIATSSQRKWPGSMSQLWSAAVTRKLHGATQHQQETPSQGLTVDAGAIGRVHSFASILSPRRKKPSSHSLPENDGWDFIQQHNELDKGNLKQLKWMHHHINTEGCPIHGWKEGLEQKALGSKTRSPVLFYSCHAISFGSSKAQGGEDACSCGIDLCRWDDLLWRWFLGVSPLHLAFRTFLATSLVYPVSLKFTPFCKF